MGNNLISMLLVSIFSNITNDCVIKSFIDFLNALHNEKSFVDSLKLYSNFVSLLYEKQPDRNIYNYIKKLIYTDENILSKGCGSCINEDEQILQTAAYELSLIDNLLLNTYEEIKKLYEHKYPKSIEIINHLPVFYSENKE